MGREFCFDQLPRKRLHPILRQLLSFFWLTKFTFSDTVHIFRISRRNHNLETRRPAVAGRLLLTRGLAVLSLMSPKLNRAEAGVITFIDTLAAVAQSNDRAQVRDAGAIAPLVALLVTGTGDVPGRCASVLRDLAQHSANRTAILEAEGIQRLVHMLGVDSKVIVTEAADALRSLCSNSVPVCNEIKKHDGIRALVKLLGHRTLSEAAMQAAQALSSIADSDPATRRGIGEAGAIHSLTRTLVSGFADANGNAKQAENWATSTPCEAAVKGLTIFTAEPTCHALLYQEEGAVAALTELMLRAGTQSASSSSAAALLAHLLKSDREGDEKALKAMIATLMLLCKDEDYSGRGWSLRFPDLRSTLHQHVEKRLSAVEEGESAAAVQNVIKMGRAVELPQERLDSARNKFDEAQAKRKREGLAAKAEERRKREEEEHHKRMEEEAAMKQQAEKQVEKPAEKQAMFWPFAEAEEIIVVPQEADTGRKKGRKDAVPSRFVPKGRLTAEERERTERRRMPSASVALDESQQERRAQQTTIAAMEAMGPQLRERMIKRMIRDGKLESGKQGLVAEYAASLGLLQQPGQTKLSPRAQKAAQESRDARNNLAQKAAQRRMEKITQLANVRAGAGLLAAGGAGGPQDDDASSYTGSSYTGSTIDSEDEQPMKTTNKNLNIANVRAVGIGMRPSKSLSPFEGKIGLAPPQKKSSKAGQPAAAASSAPRGNKAAGTAGRSMPANAGDAGSRGRVEGATSKSGWLGGLLSPKGNGGGDVDGTEGQKKKHRRRHKRHKRPKDGATSGVLVLASQFTASTPSYMLPVFAKLQQRAAEEAMIMMPGGHTIAARNRWEEKFVPGGFGGEYARLTSPKTSARVERNPPSDLSEFTIKSGAEWAQLGASSSSLRTTQDPLRESMLSSFTESHMGQQHDSRWGVVRDRLGDISQMRS